MHVFRLTLSILLGFLLGLASLYVALRVGFNPGVSLLTVLCWSLLNLAMLRLWSQWQPLQQQELACYQSLTSAMSYGAGTVIATALAALILMEIQVSIMQATLWLVFLCVLGTLWTWPIRKLMLETLPFPSGQAAAESVNETLAGTPNKPFLGWLAIAAGWTALRELLFLPIQSVARTLTYLPVSLSPMLIGLGALLGRGAIDMWIGGLFFFGLPQIGWQPFLDYQTAMWLGVGLLLGAGIQVPIASLIRLSPQSGADIYWQQGKLWWTAVLGTSLFLCLCQLWIIPESLVPACLSLLLIPILSYLACRVTGETDVVPTGGLGKLSLLLLGLGWPSMPQANMLVTGSLAGTSAASADFMTDLRCGHDLKTSAERMFRYQLAGAIFGPILIVPVFFILARSTLGSDALPAPAATIWQRFSEIHFWEHAFWQGQGRALLIGICVGMPWSWLRMRLKHLPAPLAFATAVFLDLSTVSTLAIGAGLAWLTQTTQRRDRWSALLVGESIVMVGFMLSY